MAPRRRPGSTVADAPVVASSGARQHRRPRSGGRRGPARRRAVTRRRLARRIDRPEQPAAALDARSRRARSSESLGEWTRRRARDRSGDRIHGEGTCLVCGERTVALDGEVAGGELRWRRSCRAPRGRGCRRRAGTPGRRAAAAVTRARDRRVEEDRPPVGPRPARPARARRHLHRATGDARRPGAGAELRSGPSYLDQAPWETTSSVRMPAVKLELGTGRHRVLGDPAVPLRAARCGARRGRGASRGNGGSRRRTPGAG